MLKIKKYDYRAKFKNPKICPTHVCYFKNCGCKESFKKK